MRGLEQLWYRAQAGTLFYLLCLVEPFYSLGFTLVQWRARRKKPYRASCPVISIGNISVGGTGKSVFARYLSELLPVKHAIFLRGYRGSNARSKHSKLVSDGAQTYCTAKIAGDEALMLAKQTGATVVVGRNRANSYKLLEYKRITPSAIILDDAYQHHTLYKDLEILLLDARWPLENGHCIPAGRLREKDCARASCVVLTHAELLTSAQQDQARAYVLAMLRNTHIPVLMGAHVVSKAHQLPNKVFALAGIGSFDQFRASLQQQGVDVVGQYDAGDHALYTKKLLQSLDYKNAQAIVTTAKDMVKLQEFKNVLPLYVLDISFAFVTMEEKQVFENLVNV